MLCGMLCTDQWSIVLSSVSQTVKEVLQTLVDDGLVQTDKVGSSNCESHNSAVVRVAHAQ